ncbi:MAG: dicarboxylate/amino acid:cation symporter [bacterium]|nr:dicarboxylate/amino acid:cation symporter [bacterium]
MPKKESKPNIFETTIETSLQFAAEKINALAKTKLWLKVIIGLFLGISLGLVLGPDAGLVEPKTAAVTTDWLALPGQLFLQMVKMIVIPLVFSSIIVGLLSSGDPQFLKKIGPRLIIYFLATTIIATGIGFSVALTIKPGNYINAEEMIAQTGGTGTAIQTVSAAKGDFGNIPEKLVNILPANPLESMVKGDMLGVVIFTIIVGLALLLVDKKHLDPMINLLETIQEISMTVVKWAMTLVPFAVFGLMTQITSKIGLEALAGLGMYILTVLLGLLLLGVFYNIIIFLFTDLTPGKFMKNIRDVQLLAFSTSSSAAVMPLSISTAEEKLNIKPAISQFLIPVGATINMDGTALYQVVATVFLAQVFGINLPLSSMILIVAITVGASIGAPSAPGVGIVILATILESVGIPASGVALILGVDRILDMSRTAVNVTGDLTASSFFNKQLAYLFEDDKEVNKDKEEEKK